ncbi:metal-dependent hydrolase [Candidatus Moduliflexus flocculans]|uniref:Metal-dependent hydrolase n=1 Tax=Candidatus Moduliflexus flocculans TaxID=1499966 RepID=A0A0S6VU27_9BACT|nr:metal-dependent hydrolase [Candidatus Moduliflexus flocculans]
MDLRYPIGRFQKVETLTISERHACIADIEQTPANLRAAVADLTPEQIDTPYRPEGWTVRQVAHHLPDSHLNAYIRFKLALTEDEPLIKTYAEERWAELADTRQTPIEISLTLMDALHTRWTILLNALSDDEWRRTFRHPDLGVMRLEQSLALYAWHGKHHVAHIRSLRERMGW